MILVVLQIIVSICLIVCILLQAQGTGLSGAFGGGSQIYRSKRSMEKFLIGSTIVLSMLFAVLSIVLLIPH